MATVRKQDTANLVPHPRVQLEMSPLHWIYDMDAASPLTSLAEESRQHHSTTAELATAAESAVQPRRNPVRWVTPAVSRYGTSWFSHRSP